MVEGPGGGPRPFAQISLKFNIAIDGSTIGGELTPDKVRRRIGNILSRNEYIQGVDKINVLSFKGADEGSIAEVDEEFVFSVELKDDGTSKETVIEIENEIEDTLGVVVTSFGIQGA